MNTGKTDSPATWATGMSSRTPLNGRKSAADNLSYAALTCSSTTAPISCGVVIAVPASTDVSCAAAPAPTDTLYKLMERRPESHSEVHTMTYQSRHCT
ncbi:hypothetical protein BaRGS_00033213 [Batillaria attramentaria]|uniref:Uncharacterized protein n=1 Tax=Batillaria attramentaria TaxID=370345 RepID=A0ABD0JL18_9CAEN